MQAINSRRAYLFTKNTLSIDGRILFAKKIEHFPDYDFRSELEDAKSIDDMNKQFIPRFTPYNDPDSYFNAYALTKDRLKNLNIPATLIATKDDPIIPWQDLLKINCLKKLTIELHQKEVTADLLRISKVRAGWSLIL